MTWVQSQKVLDGLLENDDPEGACEFATLLSAAFNSPATDNHIIGMLNRHNQSFKNKDDRAALFNYLSSAKHISSRGMYALFRSLERHTDAGSLILGAGNIQLKQKYIHLSNFQN